MPVPHSDKKRRTYDTHVVGESVAPADTRDRRRPPVLNEANKCPQEMSGVAVESYGIPTDGDTIFGGDIDTYQPEANVVEIPIGDWEEVDYSPGGQPTLTEGLSAPTVAGTVYDGDALRVISYVEATLTGAGNQVATTTTEDTTQFSPLNEMLLGQHTGRPIVPTYHGDVACWLSDTAGVGNARRLVLEPAASIVARGSSSVADTEANDSFVHVVGAYDDSELAYAGEWSYEQHPEPFLLEEPVLHV